MTSLGGTTSNGTVNNSVVCAIAVTLVFYFYLAGTTTRSAE